MNRKYLIITGSVLAVMFTIVGVISANYYSLVASIREQFIGVDTTAPYVHGEILFQTRGCAACHTHEAAGADGDTGPDLTHIVTYRDADYIRESIVSPNAVIAGGCPEEACEPNIMPQYGRILSDQQVDALVAYLSAQS